jgi:hypothetical protein
MNITTCWSACRRFTEVVVCEGGARISSGLLDINERRELAESLMVAIYDLAEPGREREIIEQILREQDLLPQALVDLEEGAA